MFVFVSPCTWLRPSVPTLYNEWARLFSVLFFFLLSLVCFIFTPLQLHAAGRPAGNVDGGYTKPRYRRGKKKFLQVTFLSLLLKDNPFFKPSSPPTRSSLAVGIRIASCVKKLYQVVSCTKGVLTHFCIKPDSALIYTRSGMDERRGPARQNKCKRGQDFPRRSCLSTCPPTDPKRGLVGMGRKRKKKRWLLRDVETLKKRRG